MQNKEVWSLFDGSGIMVQPWAEAGYKCKCFNFDDADHGDYASYRIKHPNIEYVNVFIDSRFARASARGKYGTPFIIFAFPPCTDIAVSGAAHFEVKRQKDPYFQIKAVRTCRAAQRLADILEIPYMIENPISVLSTMWRKPDFMFDPSDFGGYLATDDAHPLFPEYIAPRDAYPKKTCLWVGNGFKIPEKQKVEPEIGYSRQQNKLGGKSKKTKLIRSLTPRGFAKAVFLANKYLQPTS